MNHETGKSRKLNDDDMMQMQTLASDILLMERGQSKAVINTGPQNQFLIYKKPPPAKNHFVLCQGRVYFYTRGATLFCDCSHALQNTIIFLATNVCLHVTEYSDGFPLFPVPSVVHLLIRFLSGFHLPGLSVSALPTLSPLHRFRSIYFFLMRCIIVPFFFAVK